MATLKQRKIAKNEATGMRVVSQYVQEFWECGWQPFDQRNDRGIDGVIILKIKGEEKGVRINVQVKCGGGYISSHDDKHISFKFKSEVDLEKHLKYWRNQIEPAVLILINPGNKILKNTSETIDTDLNISAKNRLSPEAWWVNLKDENIKKEDSKTLILIPKKQTFGEHSKGDFVKLCRNLISDLVYPNLLLNKEYVDVITNEKTPREFYKEWKGKNKGLTYCNAINSNVIISNTGWKHITAKHRGVERRKFSKEHLGTAKQIIEQVGSYTILNNKKIVDKGEYYEYRIGLLANVQSKEQDFKLIQVVLSVREDKKSGVKKYWFLSIHQKKTR